jgi:hypothetical protein
LSSILFFKIFELKLKLLRKYWNAEKINIEQRRIMSCIEVCPNACECAAIVLKENVHGIGGGIYKV